VLTSRSHALREESSITSRPNSCRLCGAASVRARARDHGRDPSRVGCRGIAGPGGGGRGQARGRRGSGETASQLRRAGEARHACWLAGRGRAARAKRPRASLCGCQSAGAPPHLEAAVAVSHGSARAGAHAWLRGDQGLRSDVFDLPRCHAARKAAVSGDCETLAW
jgi:hypothetical protein